MELFIAVVVVALMYGVSHINAELKEEKKLTVELLRKLHEAGKEKGRDPSRL